MPSVQSHPEQGTVFSVELPVVSGAAPFQIPPGTRSCRLAPHVPLRFRSSMMNPHRQRPGSCLVA
jgi:hypothetical protein